MTVSRCLTLSVILILAIISILAGQANACSCMPSHPQTHYCNAEYVIIARVLRRSESREGLHVYKIEIKKSYKMSKQAQHYLKDGRITTAKFDSLCGIKLELGKLYVIAGRSKRLSLCDYAKEYLQMSIVERRGFAGGYKKGCACSIHPCYQPYCPQRNTSCEWSPLAKCETLYSACVPGRSIRTPEGLLRDCHWRRSPPYKACLK